MFTTHQHTLQRQLSLRQQWHPPFNEKLNRLGRGLIWLERSRPHNHFQLQVPSYNLGYCGFPYLKNTRTKLGSQFQLQKVTQFCRFQGSLSSLLRWEPKIRTYPPKLKKRSSSVTTETPIRSKMGSSLSPSSSCVCDETLKKYRPCEF